MAFEDKKGIVVASPFKLQAETLLDVRQSVETITERDQLVTLKAATEGLRVYVKENHTSYIYNGSSWDTIQTGSSYTHPTGDGNHHVPATGTTNSGKFLKAGSQAGSEHWENITAQDISGLPTRLPNPSPIKFTGAATATYDGSSEITVNIPTAQANPHALTVQLNGGTTEDTNKFTFNGSVAKTVNITPAAVGAAPTSHTHNYAGSDSPGGSAKTTKAIIDSGDNRHITVGYSKPNSADFSYFGVWNGNELRSTDASNMKNKLGLNRVDNTPDSEKKIFESNLRWGNTNFEGSYGCIDGAMIDYLSANRFQFLKAEGITVEYSRDGGDTWIDYGLTDNQKVDIFSTGSTEVIVGKASTVTEANDKYKLRVTLDLRKAGVYSELHKFCLYLSTNGSDGCNTTIEIAKESSQTVFEKIATEVGLSGWSGYNIINVPQFITFGGSDTNQYRKLRFTFGITSHNGGYKGLTIYSIKAFGGVGWTTPSNMAKNGHLYSFDSEQNVTFPGLVHSSAGFIGNATSASAVKDSNNSAEIKISYQDQEVTTASWIPVWASATKIGTISPTDLRSVIGAAATSHTHSEYAPISHKHTSADITGLPTSLKNPYPIKFTGAATATYDGSGEVTVNIPTAQASPHALTVQLNSGTTEGTNKFTFNGGAAKTVNITPAAIGAAPASHTHSEYAPTSHTHTIANITDIKNAEVAKASVIKDSSNNNDITISYGESSATSFSYIPVYKDYHISNVSKSVFRTEIGAAATEHTHNYAGADSPGGPANSAKKVDVPVGTILWSTSSYSSFFESTMGGTWEVMGTIDAVINTSTDITLYMHKKTAL